MPATLAEWVCLVVPYVGIAATLRWHFRHRDPVSPTNGHACSDCTDECGLDCIERCLCDDCLVERSEWVIGV